MKTFGKSQTQLLLAQLKEGHAVTRVTAMSLGVMNLTARISDIRDLGYDVRCEWKTDAVGREYGSFYLVAPTTTRGWAAAHLVSAYAA